MTRAARNNCVFLLPGGEGDGGTTPDEGSLAPQVLWSAAAKLPLLPFASLLARLTRRRRDPVPGRQGRRRVKLRTRKDGHWK
jgi:hypothetical protein